MKLPNAEKAIIRQEKLAEYLLNLSHPDGWGKAKFFIQCGFPVNEPEKLKSALLQSMHRKMKCQKKKPILLE